MLNKEKFRQSQKQKTEREGKVEVAGVSHKFIDVDQWMLIGKRIKRCFRSHLIPSLEKNIEAKLSLFLDNTLRRRVGMVRMGHS